MKISIITLFPEMFHGFLNESIIKRAQEKNIVGIECIQLRDYAGDDRGTVDDRPYGGGAGMVIRPKPVVKAIRDVKGSSEAHTIITTPKGSLYNQQKARQLATKDHLILMAGHYEGIDERVVGYVDEELSIGDYVLTGGELPAAVIADSVVRLLPGVLKKEDATEAESFFEVSVDELLACVPESDRVHIEALKKKSVETVRLLEYPHYTRPRIFEEQSVPEVLLSGHEAEIRTWRLQQAYFHTKKTRPDLLYL